MERQTGEKYIHDGKPEATRNYLKERNQELKDSLKKQWEDAKRRAQKAADRVKKFICGGG